jgi:hypothetical protein
LAEREADDALFLLSSGELPWCFSAPRSRLGIFTNDRHLIVFWFCPPCALRPAAGAVVMLEELLLGSSARATLRALEAVGFMHDGRSRPVDAPMAELPLVPCNRSPGSRADTSMKKWNAILRQVRAQRARKLPLDELGAASTYYCARGTSANPPRSSLPALLILSFSVPPTLFPPLRPELQMLSCP